MGTVLSLRTSQLCWKGGLSGWLYDEATLKIVKCYMQFNFNKHCERDFSVIVCLSKHRHKSQIFLGEKPSEFWHKKHSGTLLEKLKLIASLLEVAEIFPFFCLLNLSWICFLLTLGNLSKRYKTEYESSSFGWITGSGDFWLLPLVMAYRIFSLYDFSQGRLPEHLSKTNIHHSKCTQHVRKIDFFP